MGVLVVGAVHAQDWPVKPRVEMPPAVTEAMAKHDFKTAAAEADKIIDATHTDESFTRWAEVHFAWARWLTKQGEFNEARTHTGLGFAGNRELDREETLKKMDAAINDAALKAIAAAMERKEYEKALTFAAGEIKADAMNDAARQQQIEALRAMQRWPEAIRAYADALKNLPAEGGGLTAMLHRAGRDDTIAARITALRERIKRGESVETERAPLITAVVYAISLENSATLHRYLSMLYFDAQRWSDAVAEMDAAIEQAADADKARYEAERKTIAEQAVTARRYGKNYVLAARLGEPFARYLHNVVGNSRYPIDKALENQLPSLQIVRLGAIRAEAAQYEKLRTLTKEAQAKQEAMAKSVGPDNVVSANFKAEYDGRLAYFKQLKGELDASAAALESREEGFWRD